MTTNIRSLGDVIYRWPTANARSWMEEFLLAIESDPNVIAVVVVGSSVRDNVESDDLDLVILCNDRQKFRRDYKPPIEIDIRTFNVASIDEELSAGNPLLGWAVKFGESVFERNEIWSRLASRWYDRVPLPDPKQSRERARKAYKHLINLREINDEAALAELNVTYFTFLARAVLVENGIFPASRPELPNQLRKAGEMELAKKLDNALKERKISQGSV